MKYLCLCYYDKEAFSNLEAERLEELGKECRPFDAALKETGKVIMQGSLTAPQEWSYFVPERGNPKQYEGPYLKQNNLAGAFFLINADTKEVALEVASNHAAAHLGEEIGFAVEVRGCERFDEYQ